MERPYSHGLSKEVLNKIVTKWDEYRSLFGLEADLYLKYKTEGINEEEINSRLETRKNDVDTIWPELRKGN